MATINTVDVGSVDDDGTGATLRAGGQVINANFTAVNNELVSTTALVSSVAQLSILGRASGAGTGDTQQLTATQARTVLNVEDGATADQTDLEIETAYNNQVGAVDQSTAEAGSSTTIFRWTPQRVAQAVVALAPVQAATVTEIDANVDDLVTLSGVAENATDLGTFTGSTFTDNLAVKAVLQEAETQLETLDGGPAEDLEITVRNASGSTIVMATPVYESGFNVGQDAIEVEPADAAADATMPAIGLVKADILNNTNGIIVVSGRLAGVDTSAFSDTDPLYVASGGGLTATRPTGSARLQKVGSVLRSNVSNGRILVQGAGRQNDVPNFEQFSEQLTPADTSKVLIETAAGGLERTPISSITAPVDDTTALAQDPVDNTKQMRIDVGAVATATTRVLTMPDSDVDLTNIVTGTEGQKLGFDATPETAAYTDRHTANFNTDGSAQTCKFVAPWAGTVVACTGETDVGTINVAVQINGVNVTGLTAVALDSTIAGNRDTSSGASTFSAGDRISITLSGAASSPTEVLTVVEMTQSGLPVALT